MMRTFSFILLVLLLPGVALGEEALTVDSFKQQTGFEPGEYAAVINHETCNCEEWIVTDEYGTLEFTSPNCISVYNIGQKKVIRDEGRCKYETTSRLMGKLLTFTETKTCGKPTAEDQSQQETVVNTITVTFQDSGFKYEVDRKVGDAGSVKTVCEMKKAPEYGEEPPYNPEDEGSSEAKGN